MPYNPDLTKDSQGTKLEVGQKVAYNLSGIVVPGEIVKIEKGFVGIKNKGSQSWAGSLPFSKVRNSNSILVLHE